MFFLHPPPLHCVIFALKFCKRVSYGLLLPGTGVLKMSGGKLVPGGRLSIHDGYNILHRTYGLGEQWTGSKTKWDILSNILEGKSKPNREFKTIQIEHY